MPENIYSTKIFLLAAVSALSLLLAAACPSPAWAAEPQGAENPRVINLRDSREAHKVVTEDKLRYGVSFLSDSVCGGRATGSLGATAAAMWIENEWRRIGIKPMGETYSSSFRTRDGKIARDLIGTLSGSWKGPKAMYVIVMAHYDGLGTIAGTMYPGADSNASGVVAMNSVGEMFRTMTRVHKTYGRNLIFVALDSKEPAMEGARHLWDLIQGGFLKDPASGKVISVEDIAMTVNIDQVGGSANKLKNGNKDFLIVLGGDGGFSLGALPRESSRYLLGIEASGDYFGSEGFTKLFYERVSDQRIFLENGIKSVLFTSGITMNNNKPADTAKSLDYGLFKRRVWLIFHWIEAMI